MTPFVRQEGVDASEDTWKLRWMTFGSEHQFSGRIHLDGGEVRSMKRVDVDTERKLIAPGHPGHVVRGPRGRIVGRSGGRPAVYASREKTASNRKRSS